MARLPFALVLAALFVACPAHAQTPSPTVPPKAKCTKPEDFPGKLASERRIKEWQGQYNEYGACVKKYVDEMRALSDAALKSANEVVDEFNTFTKTVKDATGQ